MTDPGRRLQSVLKERGIKQAELADAVGVTQAAISKIIRGANNSRLMPKIAYHLGVSLPWLMAQTDDPSIEIAELALDLRDREVLSLMQDMTPAQRDAVLQLMRTMVNSTVPTSLQTPRSQFFGPGQGLSQK